MIIAVMSCQLFLLVVSLIWLAVVPLAETITTFWRKKLVKLGVDFSKPRSSHRFPQHRISHPFMSSANNNPGRSVASFFQKESQKEHPSLGVKDAAAAKADPPIDRFQRAASRDLGKRFLGIIVHSETEYHIRTQSKRVCLLSLQRQEDQDAR